MTVDGHIFACK